MNQTTQLIRPTIIDAATEMQHGIDSHYTSNLSRMGMTRISGKLIARLYLEGR